MITLIAAAALAAQAPAAPAAPSPMAGHAEHVQAPAGEHKAMDCCKDCCKDMEKMHSDHDMKGMQDHQEHGAH